MSNYLNLKVFLCVVFLLLDLSAMLFLVIPTGRFIDVYPKNISFALGCLPHQSAEEAYRHRGLLTLTDLDSIQCDFNPSVNVSLTVSQCGYLCFDSQPIATASASLDLDSTNEDYLPTDWSFSAPDQRYTKYRNGLFFPESWTVNVSCDSKDNCTLINSPEYLRQSTMEKLRFNQVTINNFSLENTFTMERMLLAGDRLLTDELPIECDSDYGRPVRLIQPIAFKLNSSLKSDLGSLTVAPMFDPADDVNVEKQIVYKMCQPQCLVQTKRSDVCANKEHVIIFDPQLTFWLYALLRFMFVVFLGGGMVLFEGAFLAVVTELKGDLGLQRAFGNIGIMIFSPISGILIEHFSQGHIISDFR